MFSSGSITRPRLAAVVVAATLLLFASAPVQASPDTMRRSLQNLMLGPIDMVLSPVTAGIAVYEGLRDNDDTTGVRVAFVAPGYLFYTGVQVGASMLRIVTGGLEFVPGLFLIPFEADLQPIYAPVERGGALLDWENPLVDVEWLPYVFPIGTLATLDVKLGINYTSSVY